MLSVQYIEVDVNDLRPNTFNPNKVSASNELKIRESISRNGLFRPVIVREVENTPGYEIIGGEHRWEQAKELGYKTVPVANLGIITDTKAKEIGLLDNARYGSDDTLMLGSILSELGDIDEIQSYLPYVETDITSIIGSSDIDLSSLDMEDDEVALHDEDEPSVSKPVKTHNIMRFKIGISDAEKLTKLIASTQKTHGFNTADELTNAGDALIHIVFNNGNYGTTVAQKQSDAELDDLLNEIEAEKDLEQ